MQASNRVTKQATSKQRLNFEEAENFQRKGSKRNKPTRDRSLKRFSFDE